MKWDPVGTYYGRAVAMANLESSNLVAGTGCLSDSTLLVVLERGAIAAGGEEAFFRRLAAANPLSTCLSGEDADSAFDVLLHVLSWFPSQGHIMTKVCYGETFQEVLDDFLSASWPAEERHDNWLFYRILVIASLPAYSLYQKIARDMLDAM